MRLPENPPKIKNGQVWRKKDTGKLVVITGRRGKGYYATRPLSKAHSKRSHGIYEKDLYLFYTLTNKRTYGNTKRKRSAKNYK